jgi:hypothetical protein
MTGLPHLVLTVLLALAISAAVATLGRRNLRERISHACWLFVSCMASVVAGSWIMYLIHG